MGDGSGKDGEQFISAFHLRGAIRLRRFALPGMACWSDLLPTVFPAIFLSFLMRRSLSAPASQCYFCFLFVLSGRFPLKTALFSIFQLFSAPFDNLSFLEAPSRRWRSSRFFSGPVWPVRLPSVLGNSLRPSFSRPLLQSPGCLRFPAFSGEGNAWEKQGDSKEKSRVIMRPLSLGLLNRLLIRLPPIAVAA